MAEFNINNIPSNSINTPKVRPVVSNDQNGRKIDRPNVKPIINRNGLANGGKKTLGQKFMSLLIPEDITDLKKYLIEDVVMPGIKGLILDSMAMMFFNETYTGKSRVFSSSGPRRVYGGIVNGISESKNRKRSDRSNSYVNEDNDRVDYRYIVVSNKSDAEAIVAQMQDTIRQYSQVSIGDLYSLIDITPNHTDFDWGWTDPRSIGFHRVSNGFLIDVKDARFLE